MNYNTPATVEIIDLGKLFQKTFGSNPYLINDEAEKVTDGTPYKISGVINEEIRTSMGSLVKTKLKGVEVWLPVLFFMGNQPLLSLPYSVIRITGKKNIVKTSVMYRKGTVKEQYNIDDYSINIKGFLIGENGNFPEKEVYWLGKLFEKQTTIQIDNAITNIFLTMRAGSYFENRRVVIESLDFPEVEGGRVNVKPFNMQLISDSVFVLELK